MKLFHGAVTLTKFFPCGFHIYIGIAGICMAVTGCGSGPARIQPPSFDSDRSAARAIEIYDEDGDGSIAGEELEKAPGLRAAIKNLDADKDSRVTEEEISDRIASIQAQEIGLMSFTCEVTLDGRPLEGATVLFVPEEFLEGAIHEAIDTTNVAGTASPTVPKDKRPSPSTPPGVQAGMYKVRISKVENGTEVVPARYNTETILGQEVARDDWAITNKQVRFTLSSKL